MNNSTIATIGIRAYISANIFLLSGCAAFVPPYDIPIGEDKKPTVESIIVRIKCELLDITKDSKFNSIVEKQYDLDVGLELSLTVTDDGGLAPTFSAMSGPLTVATGFKLDQSRAQNFTEELFFSLVELRREGGQSLDCEQPADTNLSGVLGLKQAFDLAMTAGPVEKWDASGATGVFGGSITFNVTKNLSATGPSWKLTHFLGPGSFLTASDNNIDKLTFGFIKGKNPTVGDKIGAKNATQNVITRVIQNQISTTLVSIDRNH